MNCIDFRKKFEEYFERGQYHLSVEMQEHFGNCGACNQYLARMKSLKQILDKQEFKILPGELDNIDLDSIMKSAGGSKVNGRRFPLSIEFPRWAWAPVAAAAAIIFMLLSPYKTHVARVSDQTTGYSEYEAYGDLDSQIYSSDSLGGILLSGLIGDDEGLENVSDELVFKTDIDELLSLMSAEELNQLYEALSEYEGRDG